MLCSIEPSGRRCRTVLCAPSQPTTNEAVRWMASPFRSSVTLTPSSCSSAEENAQSGFDRAAFQPQRPLQPLGHVLRNHGDKWIRALFGAKRMWARLRPCAITATDVTRLAFSRNGATTPAMSNISSVRGKIASALECSDCPERVPTSRHLRLRRAHSVARNSPTGPAPTIRTSVSVIEIRHDLPSLC